MSENDQVQLIGRSSFLSKTSAKRNQDNEAKIASQFYQTISHYLRGEQLQIFESSQQQKSYILQDEDSLIRNQNEIEKSSIEDELNTRKNSFIYESKEDYILRSHQNSQQESNQKGPSHMKEDGPETAEKPEQAKAEERPQKLQQELPTNQKPQRRVKRSKKRKIRQTITPEILQKINYCLLKYDSLLAQEIKAQDIEPECRSLQKISESLNICITSLRKKYREFKANNKKVIGGILINSKGEKRLYNKTIELKKCIQKLVENKEVTSIGQIKYGLQEEYGYQISKQKLQKYLRLFSLSQFLPNRRPRRSNNRHGVKRNVQNNYIETFFRLLDKSQRKLFYIGECQFSTYDFKGLQLRIQERYTLSDSNCLFTVIACVSFMDGIIIHQTIRGNSSKKDYDSFFNKVQHQFSRQGTERPLVVSVNCSGQIQPDKLTKIQQKMGNLFFAVIPPQKEELNLTNYLLTKIKDRIANDVDKTIEDRQERLEMLLSSYYNVPMYDETKDLKKALQFAAKEKSLMTVS